MQAIDPLSLGSWSGSGLAGLRERIGELAPEMGAEGAADLRRLLSEGERGERAGEALRDALSTRLMEGFRECAGRRTFGLLYELNAPHLLVQVASRLRRYASKADPRDVLQEVFFNIYRYPHRFDAAREDAFRVWSAMIVRNTVLKHLRALGRGGRVEVPFEDLSDQPEVQACNPLGGVIESESRKACARLYLTYLHLYLRFYALLSERERRALQLVEVDGRSYREAASEMRIRLENLKMVIFRARKKIHRSMRRVFEGMTPDVRPARRVQGGARSAEQDDGELGEEGDPMLREARR